MLLIDFDNGSPSNDAMGLVYGEHHIGLGMAEVMTASGDSGGPLFVNDEVVIGVQSWVGNFPTSVSSHFSTFGDIAGSVRTQTKAGWIDDIVGLQGNATIGLFEPSQSAFLLKNTNTAGEADLIYPFGPPNSGWTPITGDWFGNGITTVGLYNATSSEFFLRNQHAGGEADIPPFNFGPSGSGWLPVAGDWNANGVVTVGLFDATNRVFFLAPMNASGAGQIVNFGPEGTADLVPLGGDWNGNGQNTIGVYDKSNGLFFLRNSNSAGAADVVVQFGPIGSNIVPLVGDWNGNGITTIGVYRQSDGVFFLKNSLAPGGADIVVQYGPSGSNWRPLAGDWDAQTLQALMAMGGQATNATSVTQITEVELHTVAEAAIARWAAVGLDAASMSQLTEVRFLVSNLAVGMLGLHGPGVIKIDATAAGYGWFADPTPFDDEEFRFSQDGAGYSDSVEMDLLTAIMHELGHELGLADLRSPYDLMHGELQTGMRLLPSLQHVDELFGMLGEG